MRTMNKATGLGIVAVLASAAVASCAGMGQEAPVGSGFHEVEIDGWHLRVLGIAQDGGYPHLGCVKEHCQAVRRGDRPGSRVACLGISDGEKTYLFDATPSTYGG